MDLVTKGYCRLPGDFHCSLLVTWLPTPFTCCRYNLDLVWTWLPKVTTGCLGNSTALYLPGFPHPSHVVGLFRTWLPKVTSWLPGKFHCSLLVTWFPAPFTCCRLISDLVTKGYLGTSTALYLLPGYQHPSHVSGLFWTWLPKVTTVYLGNSTALY